MSTSHTLTDREKLILQAVVHSYVTTAEPVGSRSIVKRFELNLSPATVRNVLADLEEAGYVQQLHASSGRIPTDQGYRYYVDYLMRVQELTVGERMRIERELTGQLDDADEIIRHTTHLLALTSHHTGLVEAPGNANVQVRRIDLMPLSELRVAVLIADDCGRVRTLTVTLDEPLDVKEIPKLTAFMNENLRGVSIEKMSSSVHAILQSLMDEQRDIAQKALRLLDLMPSNPRGQLFLEGSSQLFEQPEFADVSRVREVFGLLEEQDRVLELLRAAARKDPSKTRIVIGSESEDAGLKEISIVAAPYNIGTRRVGVLGVLGPRRMHYSKLTAIVDYTANMVSRLLTRLAS